MSSQQDEDSRLLWENIQRGWPKITRDEFLAAAHNVINAAERAGKQSLDMEEVTALLHVELTGLYGPPVAQSIQ